MFSQTIQIKKLSYLLIGVVLMCSYVMFTHSPKASAVTYIPFTHGFVRYDTLVQNTATTGRVCFQIPTSTNMTSLAVTFPVNTATSYVLGAAATWTLNTNNLDTGQTAVPAPQITGVSAVVASPTVTFTWGTAWATQTTTALYCFNWSNTTALKLPTNSTETTVGNIESFNAATPTNQTFFSYSNALITGNSVLVSAVVPPSFSLVLSGSSDTFTTANLTTTTYNTTSGKTITIITNAATGFNLWAMDTSFGTTGVTDSAPTTANEHGALKSLTAGYAITNSATSAISANISGPTNGVINSHLFTGSNEDYGLSVVISAAGTGYGTASANGAYAGGTGNHGGTMNPTYFEPIASDTGTANNAVVSVKELASISGNTPAASDYTDTIYFTGAGQF
jgi:hypothetical protein